MVHGVRWFFFFQTRGLNIHLSKKSQLLKSYWSNSDNSNQMPLAVEDGGGGEGRGSKEN